MIYDELEGKEAVTWSYLLHTVELPMEIQELTDEVKVIGKNKAGGVSVAHLFSSAKTEQAMADTFFCAPTNWKNVTNAQGKALKYPNHWHFSSTTVPCKTARFLTVMDTHGIRVAYMLSFFYFCHIQEVYSTNSTIQSFSVVFLSYSYQTYPSKNGFNTKSSC